MKLAPKVIRNYKQRLSVLSYEKLMSMLEQKKAELVELKETQSKENYEYLSISVKQKIQMIEQEIRIRNNKIFSTVE